MYNIAFEVLVNDLVSTLGVVTEFAFQLLLKRVEDVSEEACDTDGIYVILQNQRLGKGLKYCWTFI